MATSAALSDAQLMSVVKSAGFSGTDAVTAFCIALAESGGRPDATNRNTNGSTDSGLFQINSIHTALLKTGNVFDPNANAKMAYSLYKGRGNKFTDWVTYNNRKYVMFQSRGNAVAGTAAGAVQNVASDSSGSSAGSDITKGVGVITAGNTWQRIGLFLAGAALLLILAARAVMNSPISNVIPVARVAKIATGKVKL